MAKVSEEGINIASLVDGIRTKVNDTNPEDREKYVSAMGQYLGVRGSSLEEMAPQIKPALHRADSKRLIDIATTLGVKPSKYKSFDEPKGRIVVTNPKDSSDLITGHRKELEDSLTPAGKRRAAVMGAQKDIDAETLKQEAILAANKGGSAIDDFINPKTGQNIIEQAQGYGIKFLNSIFKKEAPPKSPIQSKLESVNSDAEGALAEGMDPEFVKGYVDDSFKDQALQILTDNDEQISEANIQYVMEQLRSQKQ